MLTLVILVVILIILVIVVIFVTREYTSHNVSRAFMDDADLDVAESITTLETDADIISLNLANYPKVNDKTMPGVTYCIINTIDSYIYRNLDTLTSNERGPGYLNYTGIPESLMNIVISSDMLIYDNTNSVIINIIPLATYPIIAINNTLRVVSQWKSTRSYTMGDYTLSTTIDTDINFVVINNEVSILGYIALIRATFTVV